MWASVVAVVCAVACMAPAHAVPITADPCNSAPANTYPIWRGKPVLQKTVPNGKLFLAGNGNNTIPVVHLYGTPYQWGVAQAQLLQDTIPQMVKEFEEYIDVQIAPYIKFLPKVLQKIIEKEGADAALEFEAILTKKYTPQHFFDEIRGLADGLKGAISYEDLLRVHMFPELIKASCTMFGAWGPAVGSTGESVVQLRALDWGLGSPLDKYPVLAVYHPEAGNGHDFASLTWTGFIGSVTAYSAHVGISEKVWLHYNESDARAGVPFHYLLRDIAQYDLSIDDALNRIYNSERTCSIFVGLGSKQQGQFRAVEYAHEEVLVFDDVNFPAYPEHPLMEGLVYINKHTQPSKDTCLTELMKETYGKITPEAAISQITARSQTGDLHAAVYDYGANSIYVSVAGYDANGTAVPAYARPYWFFNMTEQFATAE